MDNKQRTTDYPMLASQATLAVLDFETTGTVRNLPNEPWQIGMVLFHHGKVVTDTSFTSLLRVGDRPFNRYAPGRHDQLRDQIAAAPTLQELWPYLKPWLSNRCLAAHNIATEKNVLTQAFPLHPMGPWVDTLKLARIAYPDHPSHKLEDLIADLGIKPRIDASCPGLEAHDALYDAIACATLLEFLLSLPDWDTLPLDTLARAKPTHYHRLRAARPPSLA